VNSKAHNLAPLQGNALLVIAKIRKGKEQSTHNKSKKQTAYQAATDI
jgi:hypothetical protein